MGIRCADHVTPLYPQKLALTSPTGGSRSVGIVRLRTKATELIRNNHSTQNLLFPHLHFILYTVQQCKMQFLYRPWGCQEVGTPRFAIIDTWRPLAPVASTPRKYLCYSFLSVAELTPEPQGGKNDYVNEIFQWHNRESNLRPSGLQRRVHLKVLGTRIVTWNMFSTEDPQILCDTAQNLDAMSTWRPGVLYRWLRVIKAQRMSLVRRVALM